MIDRAQLRLVLDALEQAQTMLEQMAHELDQAEQRLEVLEVKLKQSAREADYVSPIEREP